MALLSGNADYLRAEKPPLLAGVLQADGILLPFAEYKDHAWRSTWYTGDVSGTPILSSQLSSEGSQALVFRATQAGESMPLAQVPREWTGYSGGVLSRWHHSSADKHNSPIRVRHAVLTQAHCELAWALDTDFPKQSIPKNTFPIRKVGIGFTSPQDFISMKSVAIQSKIFEPISDAVQSIFAPMDDAASRNYDGAATSSSASVITIVGSESAAKGRAWYYFEAKRSHKKRPQSPDAVCEYISFMTGWFEAAPSGRIKLLKKTFYSTDCDMKEVITESPFGILRLDRRIYLISQDNHYESESYRIWVIDAQGFQPILETSGGGC